MKENFAKIKKKRKTLQLIYEANITLILKLEKDITRKLQTNIPYKYRCKNPQQHTSQPNPANIKRIIH